LIVLKFVSRLLYKRCLADNQGIETFKAVVTEYRSQLEIGVQAAITTLHKKLSSKGYGQLLYNLFSYYLTSTLS